MREYDSVLLGQLTAALARNLIAPDDRQAAEEAAYLLYVSAEMLGAAEVNKAVREAMALARRVSMTVV